MAQPYLHLGDVGIVFRGIVLEELAINGHRV